MRKLKVLHLTSAPHGIGGVEQLLLDMTQHYDRSGFEVWHCNLFDRDSGAGVFPVALKATGLPYLQIDGSGWSHIPGIVRRLARFIDDEKVDVLHVHMLHATIIGAWVKLIARRTRVLVTKHYTYDLVGNPFLRTLDQRLTRRADGVAAISHHVRNDLLSHGVAAARTRVIHNGTSLDKFDPPSGQPVEPVPEATDSLLLACIGHLNVRKGHEHAIRAMPEISRAFPAARLVIIGEGVERRRLASLIDSLGIGDAVTLLGFRQDVPDIIRRLDLLVHPALNEPFGIVLLEAMAAGKAIVATHVDGIPEIIDDGVTGLLVPPGDAAAIAKAVCALLGSAETREEMERQGRLRVEREFDIRNTVAAYEQYYRDLAVL